MKYTGIHQEYFEIQVIDQENCEALEENEKDVLRLLWFTSDNNKVKIDGIDYTFHCNEIVSLTQFHKLKYESIEGVNLLRFNRQFYCIIDHDSEVGCKGVLYYGAAQLPIIKAEKKYLEVLETAWKMAILEFEMEDELQLEMLQMMLKRILILTIRIYKMQNSPSNISAKQHDLVREFNFLIEKNFHTKHSVGDYAKLLYKSPKTISNTFKMLGEKSPLQFIQERIMVEARRLLYHTEKSVSEIAFELGFTDVQTFSRFFKKHQGDSPSMFRVPVKA